MLLDWWLLLRHWNKYHLTHENKNKHNLKLRESPNLQLVSLLCKMNDEEDPKEYRWETGYEKTWYSLYWQNNWFYYLFLREAIKEDDDGFLEASVSDIIQRAKRKRQAQKQGSSKLGMMRHLFLIVDCSDSMSSQDLKPTRLLCTIKVS